MYDDHDTGLDEEGCVVVSAKPIEDLEDGSDKHDERDVEGETGRRFRVVYRVDLVGIAGQWG